MKTAFIGFDLFFDVLKTMWESGCEVLRVFTFPTDNVYEFNRQTVDFAKQNGIPVTDRRVTSKDLEALAAAGCQTVICAGYIHKLPVAASPKCVNIHPALLPVGRGPWPLPVTILKGLQKSGCTLHQIAEKWDEGDILLQDAFEVSPLENLETLTKKVQDSAVRLTKAYLSLFPDVFQNARPQSGGEYWKEPDDAQRTIDKNTAFIEAETIARAFYGFGLLLQTETGVLSVLRGKCVPKTHDLPFGKQVKYGDSTAYAINGGLLCVE